MKRNQKRDKELKKKVMLHWYKNEIDKQKDIFYPRLIERHEELEKKEITHTNWSRNY